MASPRRHSLMGRRFSDFATTEEESSVWSYFKAPSNSSTAITAARQRRCTNGCDCSSSLPGSGTVTPERRPSLMERRPSLLGFPPLNASALAAAEKLKDFVGRRKSFMVNEPESEDEDEELEEEVEQFKVDGVVEGKTLEKVAV